MEYPSSAVYCTDLKLFEIMYKRDKCRRDAVIVNGADCGILREMIEYLRSTASVMFSSMTEKVTSNKDEHSVLR